MLAPNMGLDVKPPVQPAVLAARIASPCQAKAQLLQSMTTACSIITKHDNRMAQRTFD
jgi:hypothetical protein